MLLLLVLGLLEGALGLPGFVSWLVWLVVLGAYTGLTMTRTVSTTARRIGKQATNIRVVRDDGKPITFKTVALREVGLKGVGWPITFGVGFMADVLWPLGESKKRSLHDLIVRTHVVDTSPAPQPQTPLHWAPPMPQLAPPIAAHLNAAYGLRGRIVALDPSLGDDITVIVGALQTSAGRAQQLWDALSETSPKRCSSGSPSASRPARPNSSRRCASSRRCSSGWTLSSTAIATSSSACWPSWRRSAGTS